LKYTTHNTLTTLTALTTLTTPEEIAEDYLEMFNRIDSTGINGRDLELFFPLLIIGSFIGDDVFESIINHSKLLTKNKRTEEMAESKDIALIDWVSKQDPSIGFSSIKKITLDFRAFLGEEEDKDELWINTKWVGRALKRLGMIVDKRRTGRGMEVILNNTKAEEKIKFLK